MSTAHKPYDVGLVRKIGPLPADDVGKLRAAAVAADFLRSERQCVLKGALRASTASDRMWYPGRPQRPWLCQGSRPSPVLFRSGLPTWVGLQVPQKGMERASFPWALERPRIASAKAHRGANYGQGDGTASFWC
jgi:hypothetical protein